MIDKVISKKNKSKRQSQTCEHGKRKYRCIECGGSGLCIHKKEKSRCFDCGGKSICEHKRIKSRCRDCGGSQVCIHGREKCRCIYCNGSQICIHHKDKAKCYDCNPKKCIHDLIIYSCKKCRIEKKNNLLNNIIPNNISQTNDQIIESISYFCSHELDKFECEICSELFQSNLFD